LTFGFFKDHFVGGPKGRAKIHFPDLLAVFLFFNKKNELKIKELILSQETLLLFLLFQENGIKIDVLSVRWTKTAGQKSF